MSQTTMGIRTNEILTLLEQRNFWTALLVLTTVFAFVTDLYGMERDLLPITSHLFYIPIVIAAYWLSKTGITLTVAIANSYLGMVYFFSYSSLENIAHATAYFYIFVTIGVIVASLSGTQREQENRYRGIFNYSEAGVFLVVGLRSGLVIEEVNHKGAQQLGYTPEELSGTPFLDLFPVDAEKDAVMERISGGGSLVDFECHLRTKDGRIIQGLLSAGPLPGKRIVFTLVDITARKQAEEELKASRSQYVNALNAMMDGIFLVDREGRVVLHNATFARWLSHAGRRGDAVGMELAEAIPYTVSNFQEGIRSAFEKGDKVESTIEFRFQDKDYIFDTHFIPVFSGGMVTRVMVIMRDITRARNLE
jgi:PAS domain S-box-containing protein